MPQGSSAVRPTNGLYLYLYIYISLCVCGRLVCRSLTGIPDGHLHGVIYTRWCIDTIDSPDDEHWVARNMYRSEINTLKRCVKLVINRNCTNTYGQQNITFPAIYLTRNFSPFTFTVDVLKAILWPLAVKNTEQMSLVNLKECKAFWQLQGSKTAR